MEHTLHIAGWIAIGLAGFLVVGYLLKLLWNWLIPNISNLKRITYLQALALLIIAKILFGGFGHFGNKCFSGRYCGGKDSQCYGKWDGCGRGEQGKDLEVK
jgi:hypothetical protein